MNSLQPIAPFRNLFGKRTLIFLSCVLAVLAGSRALAQPRITVIQGGTLIDGNGGPPAANVTLVIEGNRIRTISPTGQVQIPPGAQVIEARGKYILPGLWDTHTHFHDWFPELLITNGVTSVLGYGGDPWLNALMEGTNKGKIYGPRFFLSQGMLGRIYMMENKEMIDSNIVKDREEAIRQVRALVERDAKIIKVYTSVTPEHLQAIAQEAHRLGVKVSGHIGFGAKAAALAGIDNLAHATGLPIPDLLKPEDLAKLPDMRVMDTGRLRVAFTEIGNRWDSPTERWGPNPDLTEYPLFIEDPRRLMAFGLMDRDLAREMIDLLVEKGVFIESCIGYLFREVHDRMEEYREEDHRLMENPNLHYIPERYRMNILDYSTVEKLRPDELELMKKGYRNFQWFTKTFVEAGGKITTGMDTASAYHATMIPGLAVQREMQLLVDAGVPPMKAIQAATKWAAELLQQGKDLGTLEPGKLADLILLTRDPLEDITAMKDIELVMQDGRILERGYHYSFSPPIPEMPEYPLQYADWVISEIPTQVASLSPPAVVEGSDAFTLTVRGQEFVTSSVVQMGETLLETEWVDSTQLRPQAPADLVRKVGTYLVRVVHRPPGWGKTNSVRFVVKFR